MVYVFVFIDLFCFGCCRYLFVIKCEAVSPALESEIKSEQPGITLKPKEGSGIDLKPKQSVVSKSAAQIVHEQHGK